eukprot:CCRYP_013676-RB/>CCRYP_013676-RB protein AED:0.04 eAED:0.04 QI:99/1/1/1/0.5/0.66/3/362/493
MSAGYAERLSEYPNKGVCGLPETYDSTRSLSSKLDALAKLLRLSSHTVVLTGAGCSTAAGIPDFRGPNGIWTREQREKRNKRKKGRKRKVCAVDDVKHALSGKEIKNLDRCGNSMKDRYAGSKSPTWVQCDLCKKWRRIPTSKTAELSTHWTCCMNIMDDPHHSNCSDPEEDYNRGSRTQSGFTPTDLASQSSNGGNCLPVLVSSSATEDNAITHKPCSADGNVAPSIVSLSKIAENPALAKSLPNSFVRLETSSKQISPSFASAVPTYTHRALTHLVLQPPPLKQDESYGSHYEAPSEKTPQRTFIHHIVTQNVDGLHRKSRLPRKHQSILHGDIFTEVCDTCHTEHVRPFEISSIGLAYTGRKCTLGGDPPGSCQGRLKDTLLDWENDLPEEDWRRAQEECMEAELIICMGTSLNIEPAASLCTFALQDDMAATRTKRKFGYVIVNLQKTPYDDDAALVIRGKVDDVMDGLMWRLGYSRDWDDLYDYGKKI